MALRKGIDAANYLVDLHLKLAGGGLRLGIQLRFLLTRLCAVSQHRVMRTAQRFEYCGRLRALWRPYFLRSTSRGSRVT